MKGKIHPPGNGTSVSQPSMFVVGLIFFLSSSFFAAALLGTPIWGAVALL